MIVLLTLLTGIGSINQADALVRKPMVGKWLLDLGGGYFQPDDEFYRNDFDHGINGRIGLGYVHRAGIIIGVQYRFSNKPSSVTAGLDLNTHLLGMRLGRDFLTASKNELSVGFLLYYSHASFNGSFLACRGGGPCLFAREAFGVSGIGMGLDLTFVHQFSDLLGVGVKGEYNSTWIDELSNGEFGNVGGLWVGPVLRLRL
jgi:hypothetical protein